MRLSLALLIFLISPVILPAQDSLLADSKPRILSFKGNYGFIIPHTKSVKSISNSHPFGFQIDYARQYITQGAWDYCGCYPRIGFSFIYTNFDNPEILGNSYALISFIEPFINYKGKLHPSFKLGIGLTYLDNVYNEETNPDNLFYSYPVSFFVQADLNLHYSFNEKWNVTLGATYPHISNGGVSKPNKGINFPMANLGVEYKLEPVNFVDRVRQKTVDEIHPRRWYWLVHGFFTRKDVEENQGKFTVLGTSILINRVISRLSALNLGFEFMYDASVREKKDRFADNDYQPAIATLIGGHDFLLGKFIFSTQAGLYFNKPSATTHRSYQRIGLQYYLTDNLLIGTSLKTHTSTADFVDLRISYKF